MHRDPSGDHILRDIFSITFVHILGGWGWPFEISACPFYSFRQRRVSATD